MSLGRLQSAVFQFASLAAGAVAGAHDGSEIYAERCAECHGGAGEGSDYYATPLTGDLPVVELARVIAETMPEDDPGSCVGAEAEAVARHIYDAFYSPMAQARVRPPRRELSRLTVRQLEQSLVDLFAEFGWSRGLSPERGLTVRFARKVNTGEVGEPVTRVLPRLDFKLSELKELPDNFRSREAGEGEAEFGNKRVDVHVGAHGGVYAPSTGWYEFTTRTPNSAGLRINGRQVVDANVRSGDEPAVSGRVWLVGGRWYPVELWTARTSQDDLSISLAWRPPIGPTEVIPTRFLSPHGHPPLHATAAPFPPDDRSVGYVRGAAVSPEWDAAATSAALDAVRAALRDLPALAKPPGGEARPAVEAITREEAADFCERFASAAFRRPLTAEERRDFVARFFEEGEQSVVQCVERSLLATLKSPRFLYPEASALAAPEANRKDFAVAARLAAGLWDSLPDARLRERAGRGGLADAPALRAEAERMIEDPRTRSKVAEFFEHWLRLDHVAQLSRDPAAFPDFDERVAADMRASLELLLEDLVWSSSSDLRSLFLTEELFVNARLAKFLGIPAADGDPEEFVRARIDSSERAGVVSHPYVVTAFSYYRDTSPIHRGVFLARHVLGRSLRPPPEAVAPLAPELAPEMTTRERVATQTSPDACQACHVLINGLGFTLEHFDAVGRFRTEDVGKPIDASGGYIATDGGSVRLGGARDLARFLANSEDVHRSFVTQLIEHVTKQPALAYGVATRERLLADFRAGDFSIRDLLVDVAVTTALHD